MSFANNLQRKANQLVSREDPVQGCPCCRGRRSVPFLEEPGRGSWCRGCPWYKNATPCLLRSSHQRPLPCGPTVRELVKLPRAAFQGRPRPHRFSTGLLSCPPPSTAQHRCTHIFVVRNGNVDLGARSHLVLYGPRMSGYGRAKSTSNPLSFPVTSYSAGW